jgi:TetR/AcrR family transcriptional regulator, regulator of biofilm formation and stress response
VTTVPRGEARRDHIADAALRLLARVGPDALTHRLAAAEAGTPLAATTYWFSSKEELLHAAFDRGVDRDLARLDALRRTAESWTRATIASELAHALYAKVLDDRPTALVNNGLWLEAVRRPELRPAAERWSGAFTAFYAEQIRRVAPGASDTDVDLVGAALEGLLARELARTRPRPVTLLVADLERLLDALL